MSDYGLVFEIGNYRQVKIFPCSLELFLAGLFVAGGVTWIAGVLQLP